MVGILRCLRGALREGAVLRDGASVLSMADGRVCVDGTPVPDEEARERLGWIVLNEYEAIAGLVAPVARAKGVSFDAASARRSLEEDEGDLVARLDAPLSPGKAVFDSFAAGFFWERGDRESFEQCRYADGHVFWEDGDPLRVPPIVASTRYDRDAFAKLVDGWFDTRRSQPVTTDARAASWLASAQARLGFVTVRSYLLGRS